MVKIRLEFCKALKLLFKDGSIAGFNYLTKKNFNIYEKIFWLTINSVTIATIAIYVATLWQMNTKVPTIVSLETSDYPISKVGFPGIAICNNNKIHMDRAGSVATDMLLFDHLAHNTREKHKNDTEILENLKMLGALYDFNDMHQNEYVEFHKDLLQYDMFTNKNDFGTIGRRGDTRYDPVYMMQKLGTPCDELLLECSWNGELKDCWQIFSTRLTYDGFCCTFNYQRPRFKTRFELPELDIVHPMEVRGAGWQNGLSVLINNDLDEEYFYYDLPTNGVAVLLFNPREYPDQASGGLKKIIANREMVTSISLQADVIKSSENLRGTSPNKRDCILESEMTTMFGEYRQSDCFVECKVKSMLALCGCLPFMIPRKDHELRSCDLTDVPCTQKYKRKWMTHFPRETEEEELLAAEMHDSMYCEPECLPNCDTTSFYFSTEYSKINQATGLSNRTSVVHIYYGTENDASLYTQDVNQTWFELLSNLGGVFSFFMGLSIFNVVEIAYYLIYKLINFH